MRFSTNRLFLARAVQLGFREVEIIGPESPACCRDGHRIYLWALLGKDGALAADPQATRIESPAERPAPHRNRRATGRSASSAGRSAPSPPAPGPETEPQNPLQEAEVLRDLLREALGRSRQLVSQLRQRKRRSRLVASRIASLRQLDAVDV